jgi:hypothetical protein
MATTEAAAKYGYGYCDDSDQYGYGDGAPDGTNTAPDDDNNIYGYGDAAPDGTNTAPEIDLDYGYGDAAPDEIRPKDNNGYVDYNSGYNDASGGGGGGAHRVRGNSDDTLNVESTHSVATAESYGEYGEDTEQPRRQRYRRRGSVTKYSVDGQEEVKKEHEQHQNVINQYRQSSAEDAMQPAPAFVAPTHPHHGPHGVIHESEDDAMCDRSSDDGTGEPHAHHKKKGKGKKLVKGFKNRMRRLSLAN